ncbi:MAG TPA: hypothetical protein VLA83_04980 [Candidatus Binatia bacterium]|nr:hypothetical protein [Candidatus Binatia bacterium]
MMKLFKILSSAVLLCVIGASLCGFPTTAGTVKSDQPDAVIVTNTPLPVQGTVAAMQSGLWNVGITGTPTVNVANLGSIQLTDDGHPISVRDADRPTLQPFGAFLICTFGSDQTCDIFNDIGPVPNGKVLVIEDYSGECVVPNGTIVASAGFQILSHPTGGSTPITNSVHGPVTLAGSLLPGKTEYTFGRITKVYVTAGSTISPDMGVPPGTTAGGCDLLLNGYFVNQ